MTRPLRVEYEGAIHHVTSRGNAQSDVFLSDDDRILFLNTFAEVVTRFGWMCHAYCLMGNHYHLVVETPKPNLALGMRQLNGVYTQRFNRIHHQVGHVFQGRYKSILVERDAYLLELSRYVVLNPVRAKMVKDVGLWAWSSFRATAGIEPFPAWMKVDWLLSKFDNDRGHACAQYVQFVQEGVAGGSIWQHLQKQVYLGGDKFVAQIQGAIDLSSKLSEVPKSQWKVLEKSLREYAEEYESKHKGMALAYLHGGYKMKEIAEHFDVHYSTVSRAVKKHDCKT